MKELLVLLNMGDQLDVWWSPLHRRWEVCSIKDRWSIGVIHPSIPYNAKLGRWKHELGKILDSRIENGGSI